MTTLPTPIFYVLCILAVVGLGAILCTIVVALFVTLKYYQFDREERQRRVALKTYLNIGGKIIEDSQT